MFAVTYTRPALITGAVLVSLSLLAGVLAAAATLATGNSVPTVSWVTTIVLAGLAVLIWRSFRQRGTAELRAATAELRQSCRRLAPAHGAYLAIDHTTNHLVHLTRRPWLGIATAYQLAVGETDDDWEYDPNTLRNNKFLTARFYLMKPAIADLRRITEAARFHDADDITRMDTPERRHLGRELLDSARTPRELLFASPAEIHTLAQLLEDAVPLDQPS